MTLQPPAQAATIYSVAEAAGVSIASVSRVLQGSTAVSDRTRAKVMEAVDRLEYVPLGAARSLAVRHHEALGLVLPELNGPYYSELLMGFEATASQLGLSVTVALEDGVAPTGPRLAKHAARVDGLAVMGLPEDSAPDVSRLARQKPLVVLAGPAGEGVESLRAECATSAEELASHLIDDHGRAHLLFVGDPAIAPDVGERYRGFSAALEARGMPVSAPLSVGYREDDGVAAAEGLLASGRKVDALVCANDELALAVMHRLQDAGRRVPQDVAVVGWDDVMTARYVRPGLTTVAQPVRDLGALAARRLHDRISGGIVQLPTVLPTRLVLRGSCGCPT